jgi:hypothetical protein
MLYRVYKTSSNGWWRDLRRFVRAAVIRNLVMMVLAGKNDHFFPRLSRWSLEGYGNVWGNGFTGLAALCKRVFFDLHKKYCQ